jgi:hypothetical protein
MLGHRRPQLALDEQAYNAVATLVAGPVRLKAACR